MDKKQTKKLIGMALVAPMALGTAAVGPNVFVGQADASTAPGMVTNPTIDWDTFSHESITLLWDDVPNAKGYIVERNGEQVYSGSEPKFTDNGLASGATYQYAIYAYNDYGTSDPVVDSIMTDEVYQSIVVNWLPVEGATEYLIERNGEIIYGVGPDVLTYTDDTALLGNKYRYKVIPVDGYGEPQFEDAVELGEITPVESDPENPNRAPVSYAIDEIVLDEGESKNLDLSNYFSDPDGDVLSFATQSSNSNTTVSNTGVSGEYLKVTGVTEGTSKLLVTAYDGKGAIVQRTVNVTINGESTIEPPTDGGGTTDPEPLPNVAPTSQNIGKQTIELDSTKTLDLDSYFSDEDGDDLTYTASVNNNRVTSDITDSSLELYGAEQGVSSVTVTADDGNGHTVSETFDVDVIVVSEPTEPTVPDEPEDLPPVSYDIGSMEIDEGETRSLYLDDHFRDPNGDGLEYTVTLSNENVTKELDVSSSNVNLHNLKLTGAIVGQTTVTIQADDGKGNTVQESFVVKVIPASTSGGGTGGETEEPTEPGNLAPESKHIPNGTIYLDQDKNINLGNYFSDPDGDTLSYTVNANNTNVSKAVSGEKLFLTGNRLGQTELTVYADDGNGHIVNRSFDIGSITIAQTV